MTQDEYNKPSSIFESGWSLVDKGHLGLKVGVGGVGVDFRTFKGLTCDIINCLRHFNLVLYILL